MESKEKIENLLKCLDNVNGLIPFHENCLKELYAERIRIRRELAEGIEQKCYTCVYYDKLMKVCYFKYPEVKPVYAENDESCEKWESHFTD